ncbi:aminotransferase [Arthrobacter sedimenti]|uniref:aminotransferase n=1 Tax=Arthrobacter sedimenti TaxID=2694931 RepID=UPI000B357DE4|nr:aminotransferase [Arthrobacter sedimenti]OUM42023.1 aminotransferase [Arthrobacter agilis]
MKIRSFGVEIWMNRYENECAYNLGETCVESLTVDQLLTLAGRKETFLEEILPLKLTYGAIEGTDELRSLIAGLYETLGPENTITTHGAIGANALIHETLVEPGDRVISVLPTYQQHYSIPESYGADVQLLKLRPENGYLPDLEELKSLVTHTTRLIVLNNPNNPSGSVMDRAMLQAVADIADTVGAYVLCDEVYRGTAQEGDGNTASIADVYSRGISTASMSKAFSLAGLRLGWVAGPVEVIERVSIRRDYNTISVGMIDDVLARIALENKDKILERSRSIVRTNLQILDDWVQNEPSITYLKPAGGTTALLEYNTGEPSADLAAALMDEVGVLMTPGSAFDLEGCLRIGYANNETVLREGLARVSEFLANRADRTSSATPRLRR